LVADGVQGGVRTKLLVVTGLAVGLLTAGCATAVRSADPVSSAQPVFSASSPSADSSTDASPVVSVASQPVSTPPTDLCAEKPVGAATTTLVPPDPTGARVCATSGLRGPKSPLPDELTATTAHMLADILDAATPGAATCAEPTGAMLWFSYRGGATAEVDIAAAGCAQPTARTGSTSVFINRSLALFLDDDSTARGQGGSALPDVEGLGRVAAEAAASRAGFSVDVEGDVVDAALPAGTVVLQFPPAGAGPNDATVGLLLSQQPAPTCTSAQVAVDLQGVQHGTGENFTNVQLRDTSPSACTLTAVVSITGLDAAGGSVTNTVTSVLAPNFVLTGDASPRTAPGDIDGETTGDLLLSADVRDGPDADGSCAHHLVAPATWSIVIEGTPRVLPNGDGTPETVFSACQGNLFGTPSVPLSPTP
jgi:hypothetical protein